MASTDVSSERPRLKADSDDETSTSSNNAAPLSSSNLLLDLPNEVFLRLVAFSECPARLALAMTCKKARDGVEMHEEKVYLAIKSHHRVDETFEERVCDQSRIKTSITKRIKPVSLPYRYKKIIAMKTSLYKFESGDVEDRISFPSELVVSPSEDRIVVIGGGRGDSAHVYDLTTRRLAATLANRGFFL